MVNFSLYDLAIRFASYRLDNFRITVLRDTGCCCIFVRKDLMFLDSVKRVCYQMMVK